MYKVANTACYIYINESVEVETHLGKVREQATWVQQPPRLSLRTGFSFLFSWIPRGKQSMFSGWLKLGMSVLLIVLMLSIMTKCALKCCSEAVTKATNTMIAQHHGAMPGTREYCELHAIIETFSLHILVPDLCPDSAGSSQSGLFPYTPQDCGVTRMELSCNRGPFLRSLKTPSMKIKKNPKFLQEKFQAPH